MKTTLGRVLMGLLFLLHSKPGWSQPSAAFPIPVSASGSSVPGMPNIPPGNVPMAAIPPSHGPRVIAVLPVLTAPMNDEAAIPDNMPGAIADPQSGAGAGAGAGAARAEPLLLANIITSLEQFYPLLTAAEQERLIASGNLVAALGAFDLQATGQALSQPLGFYQMNRFGLGFEQQTTLNGAKVFGGYRLGRGFYPDWYGYRETNDGGEFAVGFKLPLMQDGAIDKYRANVRQANIDRNAAEPLIAELRLEFTRAATQAYWTWVAAGTSLELADRLLKLALNRTQLLVDMRRAGLATELQINDNDRVIAQRRHKKIAAERKLQEASFKLSMFWRAAHGAPIVPTPDRIPKGFPGLVELDMSAIEYDVELALNQRPEVVQLQLLLERIDIDIKLAENQLLPALDMVFKASQDVGQPTSKGDKTPFELEAGLTLDVPLQRRAARGKLQALQGKRAQVNAKLRFTRDKIGAEVRDAVSALAAAFQQREQARRGYTAALAVENFEETSFRAGQSTILVLNLREQATFDALQLEIDAKADYFRALADYLAGLGFNLRLRNP